MYPGPEVIHKIHLKDKPGKAAQKCWKSLTTLEEQTSYETQVSLNELQPSLVFTEMIPKHFQCFNVFIFKEQPLFTRPSHPFVTES